MNFLGTFSKRFGFIKYHSTDVCIYALKGTISYYRSLGTPWFACFIYIKSAKWSGKKLETLLQIEHKRYPSVFCNLIQLLVYAAKVFCWVGWGEIWLIIYVWWILQSSLISPYFFNICVDDLKRKLSWTKLGCNIGGEPLNNFSYTFVLACVWRMKVAFVIKTSMKLGNRKSSAAPSNYMPLALKNHSPKY